MEDAGTIVGGRLGEDCGRNFELGKEEGFAEIVGGEESNVVEKCCGEAF